MKLSGIEMSCRTHYLKQVDMKLSGILKRLDDL